MMTTMIFKKKKIMASYVLYFEKPSAFTNEPLRLIYADDRNRHGKTNTLREAIVKIRKNPHNVNDWRIHRMPNEWFHEGDRTVISYVYTFEY